MPTWGDFDVRIGNIGVVLEDTARTCKREAGLKVPEVVAIKVGACSCMSVKWFEIVGAPNGERMNRLASVAAMAF